MHPGSKAVVELMPAAFECKSLRKFSRMLGHTLLAAHASGIHMEPRTNGRQRRASCQAMDLAIEEDVLMELIASAIQAVNQ